MPTNRKRLKSDAIIGLLRRHDDILKKYRVRRIGIFGSYARGKPTPQSDIDFIVDFKKPTFDNFMGLAASLEDLFGKKVDILTSEGIKSIRVKGVAQNIMKEVVYA